MMLTLSDTRALGFEDHCLEAGNALIPDIAAVAFDTAQVRIGGFAIFAAAHALEPRFEQRRPEQIRVVQELMSPASERIIDDESGLVSVHTRHRAIADPANVSVRFRLERGVKTQQYTQVGRR